MGIDVESQKTIDEAVDRLANRLDALEQRLTKDLDTLFNELLTALNGLTITVRIN